MLRLMNPPTTEIADIQTLLDVIPKYHHTTTIASHMKFSIFTLEYSSSGRVGEILLMNNLPSNVEVPLAWSIPQRSYTV